GRHLLHPGRDRRSLRPRPAGLPAGRRSPRPAPSRLRLPPRPARSVPVVFTLSEPFLLRTSRRGGARLYGRQRYGAADGGVAPGVCKLAVGLAGEQRDLCWLGQSYCHVEAAVAVPVGGGERQGAGCEPALRLLGEAE